MIFQSFNLIPGRTAVENVELPMIFAEVAPQKRRERGRELLHKVGLDNRDRHRPSELSGGEQQRVAVARALANRPRILLADEPTGNLDSAHARGILELLAALNRDDGITIILVTHETELARIFAGEIIRLNDGCLIEREVLR